MIQHPRILVHLHYSSQIRLSGARICRHRLRRSKRRKRRRKRHLERRRQVERRLRDLRRRLFRPQVPEMFSSAVKMLKCCHFMQKNNLHSVKID